MIPKGHDEEGALVGSVRRRDAGDTARRAVSAARPRGASPGAGDRRGPAADSRPASGQPADDAGVDHGTAPFGLTSATAPIIGTIVGVGIFNLPTSLAVSGGPYAYGRAAFGNAWGFTNAWSYWITAWVGNAAIAVGWVLYLEHFINTGHNPVFSVLLVLPSRPQTTFRSTSAAGGP
jgi:amino acid transporter